MVTRCDIPDLSILCPAKEDAGSVSSASSAIKLGVGVGVGIANWRKGEKHPVSLDGQPIDGSLPLFLPPFLFPKNTKQNKKLGSVNC